MSFLGTSYPLDAQNADAGFFRGKRLINPLSPSDTQAMGWDAAGLQFRPLSYMLQSGASNYCAPIGANTTTYTCTLAPAITSYGSGGLTLSFKPDVTNTGASTLNVNSVGAAQIQKVSGGALTAVASGDLVAGVTYTLVFNGTVFVVQLGSGGSSGFGLVTYNNVSGTPTFTANNATGTTFVINLTGNVTSSTLAGATSGQLIATYICQDTTGGISFAFPANFVGASTIDSTASTCTTQIFRYDGTNAVALAGATVMSGSGANYLFIPGSTSGGIKFQVPAVAGSSVLTYPAGTTDFSATGPGFVKQASAGAAFTVAALGTTDIPAVALSSGTSVTLAAPAGFYVCTSTCTVTLPVPAAGYQFCILNGNNVSTVITLAAIGSSARYENTARTAYGTAGTGTLVSGGAAADKVCLLGLDSTHYLTVGYQGTWTAN